MQTHSAETAQDAARGTVLRAGQGREFSYGPNRVRVKLARESGGQQFGVLESVFPPGARTPRHWHARYEEAFYVLQGEIEYTIGAEHVTATPGTFMFIPAGVSHSFHNVGTGDARHLVIMAPPEAVDLVEAAGNVTPKELLEVFARHDSHLVADD